MSLKKFQLKLEYYYMEYNETLELQKDYQHIFNNEFKDELQHCYHQLKTNNDDSNNDSVDNNTFNDNDNENNDETNEETNEETNDTDKRNSSNKKKNSTITKIFRKLSKIYHPDLNEENLEIYNKIKEAYDKDDIIILIMYAIKNNIKINDIDMDISEAIDTKISELETEMDTIKKTAAWLWCTEKNDERKKLLKKYFYNKWGYNESENSTDNK